MKKTLKTIVTFVLVLILCVGTIINFNGMPLAVAEENDVNITPEEFAMVKAVAKQGKASAQYCLGVCYKNGLGVSKDLGEAVKWFRKAAEQGDASAQYCLGVCYKNGEGVSKDFEEAVKWFRKAAEQGDANAQTMLGACYCNGEGVSKDLEEAVKWFRKAAEQGDANAQNNLGDCYYNGEGVSEDFEEAVKWYRKAAEQGNADAQNNLRIAKEEEVKAAKLRAEKGTAQEKYILGNRFYFGEGVSEDRNEALKWWEKAAAEGHQRAAAALKKYK
jgi:TPR repeat protein